MIVLVSILGSAASTYYLFVPKSITTLPASTITQTTEQTVTAIAPTTTTETLVQTITSTSSILLAPIEVDSLNHSTGLELELATNASEIFSHPDLPNESGAILVVVSLFNTLQTNNNLTAPQDWPLPGLSPGACSAFNEPFGIAVMKGYYTKANITSGEPLSLFAPTSCPIYISPAYFVFDPKSNYVRMISVPQSSVSLLTTSTSTLTVTEITRDNNPLGDAERAIPLNGYCCTDLPGPPDCACFTFGSIPFAIGTYTVVGGDEWGDLVLLHFNVLP
jgi:hypothetical protein